MTTLSLRGNLRFGYLFGKTDVLPRPLQQRRFVDRALPVIAKHEGVARMQLLPRLLPTVSKLDLLLQIFERLRWLLPPREGGSLQLGKKQRIAVTNLSAFGVLGVVVGLGLPALELAELLRPPEELVVLLVPDLIDRAHVQVVCP